MITEKELTEELRLARMVGVAAVILSLVNTGIILAIALYFYTGTPKF